MSTPLYHVFAKKVPTLYETDTSKYVGPHKWQIHGWARLVRKLMYPRAYERWVNEACSEVHIVGTEHLESLAGPCVFVGNHQSHLDTPLVSKALPGRIRSQLYFGAAQDRWFVKGKKKLMLKPWYQSLVMGNFPILRGGGAAALEYAHWLLGRGRHVFLFPEGTRATNDELGEFKHGPVLLALRNQVPVVPIYLSGLRDIRPKGTNKVVRGIAGVEIMEPIVLPPDMEVAAATALVRERMAQAHRQYLATRGRSLSEAA